MFLTKRQKITISSILLAVGLFFISILESNYQLFLLLFLVIGSYVLSLWSIYGDISRLELVSLFVLPVTLTLSFGLFLMEFQVSRQTTAILSLVYVVTMYTILLSENIFNVSTERNIPLVRAARTVGYLTSLFVAFAFYTLLFGIGLNNFLFAIITAFVGTLLFVQGFWQIELKATDTRKLVIYSACAGLLLGEFALAFSFWPLTPPKLGIALSAVLYILLGITQNISKNELAKRTVYEYLFVGGGVILLLILTTSWGV